VIKTDSGEFLGEASLDKNSDKPLNIQDIKLDKKVNMSETAVNAIMDSDFLIFGPGDVYSSILPNTLVEGFDKTISKSKAKKILIINIMNKKSETNGFKTSDFVELFEKRGIKLDYIMINKKTLPIKKIKGKYGNFSGWVEDDLSNDRTMKGDFINEKIPYEHDPDKILPTLKRIIN
jgi:uncharacterized cofD-like protein